MDWALEQAQKQHGVISGFHSPLEQSVLRLLLEAKSPVVVLLARPVVNARLPLGWQTALAEVRMAVVSSCSTPKRLTHEHDHERNEEAAQLSDAIVIAYASQSGELERQSASWRVSGLTVTSLIPA